MDTSRRRSNRSPPSAGVAPRTFFHHFATKDDILFDGYAERLHEATRRFRAAGSESLWGALAEASSAVAEAISEQPELFVVRARMYHNVPALRATMLRINEDWIDQITGEVARWLNSRHGCRPAAPAGRTLINSANRAAIDVWVAGGGRAIWSQLDGRGRRTDAAIDRPRSNAS